MLNRMLCISFASVGELRLGAVLDGWGQSRRDAMEAALRAYVMLGVDEAIAQHWAQIKASRQQMGRPIASEDCWIAATAVRHGIPLLTHNASDYEQIPNLSMVSFAR